MIAFITFFSSLPKCVYVAEYIANYIATPPAPILFLLTLQIDRRLLNRHELHSYFESQQEEGLPIMKVVKELISVPTAS